MNDFNIAKKRYNKTVWMVWGIVLVGVVCASMVVGWVGSFVESHTEEQTQSDSVVWCAVCADYQLTITDTIGNVVACSVCDSVLAW